MSRLLRAKTQIRSLSEETNQYKGHRAYLAEDYDNISQFALITFSRSSSTAGVRARVAAGDFNNRSEVIFPKGTPVTVFSNHGQIEILSLGLKPERLKSPQPLRLVQTAFASGGGGGVTVTFPAPVTAGNLLILTSGKRNGGTTGAPTTFSAPGGASRPFTGFGPLPTTGNSWEYVRPWDVAGADSMFSGYRVASGDEQSLNALVQQCHVAVYEYAGQIVSFETVALNQGGSATKTIGTFSKARSIALMFYIYGEDWWPGSGTPLSGWTMDYEATNYGGGHPGFASGHQTNTSALTAQITNTAALWSGIGVSLTLTPLVAPYR